jgi:hypothetical protein
MQKKMNQTSNPSSVVFPATMGSREKLVTLGVGFGVGLGLPVLMGTHFAVLFHERFLLLFPVPFMIAFGLVAGFRPTAFVLSQDSVIVQRPFGPVSLPFETISAVKRPPDNPIGMVIRLLGVSGIFGEFGIYWNRNWGIFRLFVSNHQNRVELLMTNGSRVQLSPDQPNRFVADLIGASSRVGVPIRQGASASPGQ